MKRILIILLLVSPPAWADGEIETREELCQLIKPYEKLATASQGADYVPGMDVHGKQVAPADLNTGSEIMDPVIIPVEINLAQRFGLNLPTGAELKPAVANFAIYQNGKIEYNGRDIARKIHVQCKNSPPEEEKTAPPEAKTDGQKAANTVVSSDKIDGQYPEYNE